ncbi:MAG: hypothetical protein ACRDYX_16025 [Egibacteraceae bacterium]
MPTLLVFAHPLTLPGEGKIRATFGREKRGPLEKPSVAERASAYGIEGPG